ncbi:MAG TPA: sialidase family protein [Kofleriaceae bacterium]
MTRALLLLALLAGDAAAHGRDPYAVRIQFRPGQPQDVLAGTTIGLLTSHDGGTTWRWTCEEAIHYQDPFDPDYAYAGGGAIFAQSFVGLGVDRDTCKFEPTQLGDLFVSAVTTAGAIVYVAAADTTDSSIYKSTDEGITFTAIASPGMPGDWWLSLEVAPSDPQRVYLAGYRLMGTTKQYLVFVSTNGGTSFSPIATTSLVTTEHSSIDIVGVGPNPDTVYARVTAPPEGGDAVYRSTNAGMTWTKIFGSQDPYGIAWLARGNGELIAATRTSGAWRSTNGGMTWEELTNPPHISTLVEAPNGDVWAGTQNFLGVPPVPALPTIPSDGYILMKSTDLVTWTPVLRVQDLVGPECATGSDVYEQCAVIDRGLGTAWCCLVTALGITSTEVDCSGPRSCGANQGDVTAGDVTVRPPDGCCQGSPPTSVLTALLVLITFGYAHRPRRAARRRARGHR